MPTPSPRHLARPRRPWRLLLVAFGFTTAVLAALVASATLLPQPEPPRRAPGVALPTITTEPAPTSLTTRTTEPTTTPSPTNQQPGHQAVRYQPADHHWRTRCHSRRPGLERHDRYQHTRHSWGHEPAPR